MSPGPFDKESQRKTDLRFGGTNAELHVHE